MNSSARVLPYEHTGSFSGLVLDYLQLSPSVAAMYQAAPTKEGIRMAVSARRQRPVNRPLLHTVFNELYATGATPLQQQNIENLLDQETYTICTAHQPNIFSGYLYFIYKILHVIRIADELNKEMPAQKFVPVFYMGSEDNDLDELGQVKVDGVKMVWETKQEGSVGRMRVDKALLQLIAQLEGQLGVQPHGAPLIALLRDCYREGITIAEATKALVDRLFSGYGLLVLNADDARLKAVMHTVFTNDLVQHDAYRLVTETGAALGHQYKVQVNPREINLFYMVDGLRERIIEQNGIYSTESGAIKMNQAEILQLLKDHPECFSPNVVLRALYQESILPDVAFVGGGSEVAYWLELKAMFDHFQVPLPALVLRNSFVVVRNSDEEKLHQMDMKVEDLFVGEFGMVDQFVKKHSANVLDVDAEQGMADALFAALRQKAGSVDKTLQQHIDALQAKFSAKLTEAGKKLLRAEKRKFDAQKNQLVKLRNTIFPNGNLQERVDNFMPYYAKYGPAFIDMLFKHSLALEQKFTIVTIQD